MNNGSKTISKSRMNLNLQTKESGNSKNKMTKTMAQELLILDQLIEASQILDILVTVKAFP